MSYLDRIGNQTRHNIGRELAMLVNSGVLSTYNRDTIESNDIYSLILKRNGKIIFSCANTDENIIYEDLIQFIKMML